MPYHFFVQESTQKQILCMFKQTCWIKLVLILIAIQIFDSAAVCLTSSLFIVLDSSFSTDDDNDTEVEAVDMDTELNLVTECWVEPQSGTVMNCMEQHLHFKGFTYQEIPQAVCRSSTTFRSDKQSWSSGSGATKPLCVFFFSVQRSPQSVSQFCLCSIDISERPGLYVHHDDLWVFGPTVSE